MTKTLEQKLAQFITHMREVEASQRRLDIEGTRHLLVNDREVSEWLDRLNKAGEMGPPMFIGGGNRPR